MTNPCFGCQKRHTLCWSDCEDYKAWKQQIDAISEKRMAIKKEEYVLKVQRKKWRGKR